jgi:sulfite exporter TauE/SafE/copper chaperone CopZ
MNDVSEMKALATVTANVTCMHCASCDVTVERRLKQVPGVRRVKANYRRGTAEITYVGLLDIAALQHALADDGYTLSVPGGVATPPVARKNSRRDYAEIGATFLIIAGVVLALNRFNLLPKSLSVSGNMNYGIVFLIGMVASVSSCIAVTGGLLVAVAAKYNEASPGLSGMQRWRTHIAFNVGRIISYTLLGGAIGVLGAAVTPSPEASVLLTIAAAVVMIVLGFQMLRLFPSLGYLMPAMPKALSHKIHDLSARQSKGGAFALGALTFFLPCGFTQALQLYVLTKGSFTVGALTMLAFSLGTLPALLSLSAISSFAKGAFQKHFMRLAGTAVIMLGILNIHYGLVLADASGGADPGPVAVNAPASTGVNFSAVPGQRQMVRMQVVGFNYFPNKFTVKVGVPVEWQIDGQQASGCGHFLYSRSLGIRALLSNEETTVVQFTPTETGDFGFNCGMGMMTPGSKFTVVPNA